MRISNPVFAILVVCLIPISASAKRSIPIADLLSDIVAGKRSCKALTMEYDDGRDDWGWTRLRVTAGVVTVSRIPVDGAQVNYTGSLPTKLCKRMARTAARWRLWRVKLAKREPLPDESQPTITMAVGTEKFTVTTYDRDVQNNPAFAMVRGQILILVRLISKGAVNY